MENRTITLVNIDGIDYIKITVENLNGDIIMSHKKVNSQEEIIQFLGDLNSNLALKKNNLESQLTLIDNEITQINNILTNL